MIRIEQLWLCTAPMDMRAGAERLMSCVVQTTGAARAHHGYPGYFTHPRRSEDGIALWMPVYRGVES